MNLGQAIKDVRRIKGLNQGELAKAIGLTQTSVSQIEGNKKQPSQSTMKKICDALDTPQPLMYLMATEETDVPVSKRKLYKLLYPTIKSMIEQILA